MQRNTYKRFCVGGKRHLLISPISTNHLTSLAHLSSSPARDRSGYQTSAVAQLTLPPSSPLFSCRIWAGRTRWNTEYNNYNRDKNNNCWLNKCKAKVWWWWWRWWWINESKRSVHRALIDVKSVLIYMLLQTLKWVWCTHPGLQEKSSSDLFDLCYNPNMTMNNLKTKYNHFVPRGLHFTEIMCWLTMKMRRNIH